MTTIASEPKRKVNARTVINNFNRDERIVLEDMAEEYGMSYDEFISYFKSSVSDDTFSEIEYKNSKRMKHRKKKSNTKKKVFETQQTEITINTTKEEKTMKENTNANVNMENGFTVEELEEKKAAISQQIDSLTASIEALTTLIAPHRQEIAEEEAKVKELKNQLSMAEQALAKHIEACKADEDTIEDYNKQLAVYNSEMADIEKEIESLTLVYLLAPSFKGKLPSNCTIITCFEKDGTIFEDVDEKLISEPSFEKMEAAGFETRTAYKNAHKFVQLVAHYLNLNKNFKILNNSKEVKKLIEIELGSI